MTKGLFIAIEGGDYTGKTTFANQLERVLSYRDTNSRVARLPGSLEVGESIRDILVNIELDNQTRLCLFAANRSLITNQYYNPLVKFAKMNLICTRWRWSSDVYQGYSELANTLDHELNIAQPDIYILLECTNEVMIDSHNRSNPDHPDYVEGEREEPDLLGEENTVNYGKVRSRFREMYDNYNGVKFLYNYNNGASKLPSDEEFIELCKDFLTEIGYFELPQVTPINE